MKMTVKKVQHPYITTNSKIRHGEPVISGTSIRVIDIAVRYEIMGMSPEDIIIAHPHLNLSQIHDALSYYYEHKKEIDRIWRDSTKKTETLKRSHPSIMDKKIGTIKDILTAEEMKNKIEFL